MPKSKIHGAGHLQLLISEIFLGIFFFRKSQQNRQNTKKMTVSKWQDFEVFKIHWFLEFEQISLWYFSRKPQNIFQNIHFLKNCYFHLYFWFLIGFTHSNNLSQVLLWSLVKKFLCGMYTHCIPKHLYLPVCS